MTGGEPTFGYHPDFENLTAMLDLGRFSRALVVGLAVERIVNATSSCRNPMGPEGRAEGPYGLMPRRR